MRKKSVITILSLVFITVLWQIISLLVGYPAIFPPLHLLLKQLIILLVSKGFLLNVFSTILRGISGFLISFIFAFLMAGVANFSVFWKTFFHPLILVTRSVPVISLVLLAILWFSPDNLPVFIALLTMFPILYQNILTGLQQTDKKLVEMAQVFGQKSFRRFFTIYIPSSKNTVYDGISTALGFGWRAIIIGEVLAQPVRGIGTAMKQAQAFINVSELIAWTVVAIIISFLFDLILKQIRKIHMSYRLLRSENYQPKLMIQSNDSPTIKFENINKNFNSFRVFESCNYDFKAGRISVLKGASGKGKTTLLRLIAGLETADSGIIDITGTARYSYAFQDIRLLPWLNVTENIVFGMDHVHLNKHEISQLEVYLLEKMELTEHSHKFPHELSGGQQQRVGLARALAAGSNILLLDEPLSGLDKAMRSRITAFLSEWISIYQPVVVWATHQNTQLTGLEITEIEL